MITLKSCQNCFPAFEYIINIERFRSLINGSMVFHVQGEENHCLQLERIFTGDNTMTDVDNNSRTQLFELNGCACCIFNQPKALRPVLAP